MPAIPAADFPAKAELPELTWNRTQPAGVNYLEHKFSLFDVLLEGRMRLLAQLQAEGQSDLGSSLVLVVGARASVILQTLPQFNAHRPRMHVAPPNLPVIGRFDQFIVAEDITPAMDDRVAVLKVTGVCQEDDAVPECRGPRVWIRLVDAPAKKFWSCVTERVHSCGHVEGKVADRLDAGWEYLDCVWDGSAFVLIFRKPTDHEELT